MHIKVDSVNIDFGTNVYYKVTLFFKEPMSVELSINVYKCLLWSMVYAELTRSTCSHECMLLKAIRRSLFSTF